MIILRTVATLAFLTREEARLPPQPDLVSAIDADSTLDDDSKAHIINQNRLLQALSAYNRTNPPHDLVTDEELGDADQAGAKTTARYSHLADIPSAAVLAALTAPRLDKSDLAAPRLPHAAFDRE